MKHLESKSVRGMMEGGIQWRACALVKGVFEISHIRPVASDGLRDKGENRLKDGKFFLEIFQENRRSIRPETFDVVF